MNPQIFINSTPPSISTHPTQPNRTILSHDSLLVAFATQLPPSDVPITSIFEELELALKEACRQQGLPAISKDAFSNVRGSWFEFMVTVALWNARIANPQFHSCLILKLPNISTLDYIDLFEPEAKQMLHGLRQSLAGKQVNLITSNPDILCVRNLDGLKTTTQCLTIFNSYSSACSVAIKNAYTAIVGHCRYNSIEFGMALKLSIRPDRRLQMSHEGSVVKALNAHLQTRFWDPSHQVRYYAATGETPGPADIEALKTAATHSITDVHVRPVPAVDRIFLINKLNEVDGILGEIMSDVPNL